MTKEEAKEIYDATVKPAKDQLELARIERAEFREQLDEVCKRAKEAYQEYKDIAREARRIYYKNIGE
jgi:hypothetical protein